MDAAALEALADSLHSAAIRLLRRLRQEDPAAGLSGPALSALSVIVFNPGVTPTALADAEQVTPPTVSRALKELDAKGLIERRTQAADRRSQALFATPKGRRKLENGRKARVARLARALEALPANDRAALERAVRALGSLNDL